MPTILIVDDDPMIRSFLSRKLKSKGWSILTACDGSMALAILADTNNIDYIISDVQMPVMDGVQLYRWVQENMPVLTGSFVFHSGSLDVLQSVGLGDVPQIEKPFMGDLAQIFAKYG